MDTCHTLPSCVFCVRYGYSKSCLKVRIITKDIYDTLPSCVFCVLYGEGKSCFKVRIITRDLVIPCL